MSDSGLGSSQSVTRAVDRLIERYSGSEVARATVAGAGSVVGAIPVAGAVAAVFTIADALMTTRANKLASERWARLFNALGARVDRLGEDKLDRGFLESEDFADLMWRVLIAGAQTRSQEKLEAYATILAGSLSVERPPDLDPEALLDAVTGLSPQEVQALHIFWQLSAEATTKVGSDFGMDRFVLQRLAGAGFLYEETGAILDYSGGDYLATSALKTLMLLVKQFEPSQGQVGDQEGHQ